MAVDTSNLVLLGDGNGFGYYRYDTTDALTDVDADGYFNNADDTLNLAVGDLIKVVVWTTAVRTGTISTVGEVVVLSITSNAVDCSNDLMGATIIDSD
jgi:hypothetical protein